MTSGAPQEVTVCIGRLEEVAALSSPNQRTYKPVRHFRLEVTFDHPLPALFPMHLPQSFTRCPATERYYLDNGFRLIVLEPVLELALGYLEGIARDLAKACGWEITAVVNHNLQ